VSRKHRPIAIAIAATAARKPLLLPVVVMLAAGATVVSPVAGLAVVAAALAWASAEG